MNIEKYTERARGFIQSAQQIALGRGHQQFTPVHLLKVLMDDDQGLGSGLIDRSGGDSKAVRAGVEAALKKLPVVSGDNGQIYLSREMARVFDTAESAAQKAGDSFVTVERLPWEPVIHHKDLMPVVYVTGDEAGELDSPLYGMFDLVGQVSDAPLAGTPVEQRFLSAPVETSGFSIKWDGEWQITYETFRDMGLAYSVGLLLIYLLVVAQFRDYLVPLVIMAPIPLTVIGVMPGHALLGAQFTATSMIGMIALAGIIVRNSILLVDFINQEAGRGVPIAEAVIDACAVRAKPIALTGVAAMLGAFFILDDPIFNGLAISLVFGIFVSTLLTLVVIPLLYYSLLARQQRPENASQ